MDQDGNLADCDPKMEYNGFGRLDELKIVTGLIKNFLIPISRLLIQLPHYHTQLRAPLIFILVVVVVVVVVVLLLSQLRLIIIIQQQRKSISLFVE